MTQPVTAVQKEFTRVSSASWTLLFPFQPYNGGEGVSLPCTVSTARVALVGEFGAAADDKVNIAVIVNTGSVPAFVRFGDVTVVATTASMAVPAGAAVTCTIPGANDAETTYLAGITSAGSTTLQITTGFGN